jgi:hypothetical protein
MRTCHAFSRSHTVSTIPRCFAFELAGQKRTRSDLPLKIRRFGKSSYQMQTSANGKIASLFFLPANSKSTICQHACWHIFFEMCIYVQRARRRTQEHACLHTVFNTRTREVTWTHRTIIGGQLSPSRSCGCGRPSKSNQSVRKRGSGADSAAEYREKLFVLCDVFVSSCTCVARQHSIVGIYKRRFGAITQPLPGSKCSVPCFVHVNRLQDI